MRPGEWEGGIPAEFQSSGLCALPDYMVSPGARNLVGLWVSLPRSIGPPVRTRPQWERQSSGCQALMHMEVMAAFWSLQGISGTVAEEEEQNNLDNYPSKYLGKWTL